MAFLSNTQHACRPAPATRPSLLDLLSLYRQRRALGRLDKSALKDIGIAPEEAHTESRRSFWDVPANWQG